MSICENCHAFEAEDKHGNCVFCGYPGVEERGEIIIGKDHILIIDDVEWTGDKHV
jgi:hypothetical protein